MDTMAIVNFQHFKGLDYLTKKFAENLHELREYTQTSLWAMGKYINMPFQSIARYEKGKTEPSISNAFKISAYFFTTLEEFILSHDIITVFESNLKELCLFAPTQNIPLSKERFPKIDIDSIIGETINEDILKKDKEQREYTIKTLKLIECFEKLSPRMQDTFLDHIQSITEDIDTIYQEKKAKK